MSVRDACTIVCGAYDDELANVLEDQTTPIDPVGWWRTPIRRLTPAGLGWRTPAGLGWRKPINHRWRRSPGKKGPTGNPSGAGKARLGGK